MVARKATTAREERRSEARQSITFEPVERGEIERTGPGDEENLNDDELEPEL